MSNMTIKYEDWLRECVHHDGEIVYLPCDIVLAIADWIEAHRNVVPTIDAAPRWIPCEEKLPEPVQEVLVTGTNGCVYTSRIVHGEFEYGGNVIAWMPLPDPYEERKSDE